MTSTTDATEVPACTLRDLDDTTTAVDLDGQLLAFAYRDPTSPWWLIRDRHRVTRRELGDFATRQAAVDHITRHRDQFTAAIPPAPRDPS